MDPQREDYADELRPRRPPPENLVVLVVILVAIGLAVLMCLFPVWIERLLGRRG